MKVMIDTLEDGYSIVLQGLTMAQGQKIQTLVDEILFPGEEVLDPLIHVSLARALDIIAGIKRGDSKTHFDSGVNEINDIKYVRNESACGLKEAKDFVEKHFTYPTPTPEWRTA